MEEKIKNQNKNIKIFFQEKLLPVLFERVTNHNQAIEKIEELQKSLVKLSFKNKNKTEAISVFTNYKASLGEILLNHFVKISLSDDAVFFDDYYKVLDEYILTLEETIKRVQDKERFYSQPLDSKKVRFKKTLKRSSFNISKIPLKIGNIFRKNKKSIEFWSHDIPFQNITQHYFKNSLVQSLLPIIDDIYKEISEITSIYWQIDKVIDEKIEAYLRGEGDLIFSDELFSKIEEIPKINDRIERQDISADLIFEGVTDAYKKAFYKVDTVELSKNTFSQEATKQKYKEVCKKLFKNETQWNNTYKVLKDDWELDIEIYTIIFALLSDYEILQKSIVEGSTVIDTELNAISDYIKKAQNRLKLIDTDTALKAAIIKEVNSVKEQLNTKILVKTTSVTANQELPILINEFEGKALAILKNISPKKAISTDNNYSLPIASSTINYVAPYELINYESWPRLSDKINQAKIDLTMNVDTFVEDINAIGQVYEFNLESALSLFDNITTENTPKAVALDGFQRSLERVDSLKGTLKSFDDKNHELLFSGIQDFNKSILALTDTDNIIEIKLTIAKAKSIEKSKLLKQKVINTVKNFIPIALTSITGFYLKSKLYTQGVLLRTGLYKQSKGITGDLSDFLKEAERALDQLPFVYQRLFRSETLQNEDLFIGRSKGLDTLKSAYQDFEKDNYATTIVTGERGAGKTSLVHYFLNSDVKTSKYMLLSPQETLWETKDFVTFLNMSLSQEFKTINEYIQYFNNKEKSIVVLENIQYLYFRKVNGFEVLHQLSELIAQTKKSTFWILTSSKYAFEYLNKSIQLSDIFPFNIEMDDIDKATMVDALMKRHKMSGYNLYFEEPPVAYLSKKFIKLNPEDKQKILKEEFFSDINKIAKSNFKIAFMYWIRSTVSVNGSTINMRSLKDMDLSFLDKLSSTKLLLLNMILLQERLRLKDIVSLSGVSEKQTRRMIYSLYEDGLLTIDDNQFYNINILLYRQITSLLKSKNFIH